MKNKYFLFTFVLSIFLSNTIFAQTLITNDDQLYDGELVAMISQKKNIYYPLSTRVTAMSTPFYFDADGFSPYTESAPTAVCTSALDAITYSCLFRVIRDGNRYLLYSVNAQTYFCNSNDMAGFYDKSIIPSDYAGLKMLACKDGKKNKHIWKIGKRYMVLDNDKYRLLPSTDLADSKKNYLPVQLYEVGNVLYGYNISEDRHLRSNYSIPNKLFSYWRNLKNDALNTLVMPFDVPNYQKVFGLSCQAYSPVAKEVGVDFVKVKDDATLKAFMPYLMTGKFFAPPYIIPQATLDFVPSDSLRKLVVGDVNFWMVLSEENIGGDDNYYMSGNQLYSSKDVQNVKINATKWFLDDKLNICAKGITLDGKQIPTGIVEVTSASAPEDGAVYNLQGVKVAESKETIKNVKGVYISKGKVFVVK